MLANTAPAQNAAHHADLTWIKVGRSEYMRGDGLIIRKSANVALGWEIFLPTGERPQHPNQFGKNGFVNTPAWGHTLTVAKYNAESITLDAPVYVRPQR